MRKIKIEEELKIQLKELHLTTIQKRYMDIASMARRETLSYEEFLSELLREESNVRQNRRRERLLRASRIPADKNIDNFDLKRLSSKALQQTKTLLTGAFIDHTENILVFGNPGSGNG